MLGAFLIPVLEGAPIVLCDVWDPARVLELIESDGLSIGGGPPYFVTSVLDHPDCTPDHVRHFTTVGLGGSTVPAAVTKRLADLGLFVFRSYGSTEHPSITGSRRSAPEDKRLYTDGDVRPGVEIRLDPDGEIFSRGPGPLRRATPTRADRARLRRRRLVPQRRHRRRSTPTGSSRSPIARPTSSSAAREHLRGRGRRSLLAIPAVAEVAVVAAPDERLGERAAAVLRIRDGQDMPTTRRGPRTLQRRRAWPPRSGQRNCTGSTTSHAPLAARCRSSSFARTFGREPGSTLRRAASENRILSIG